MTSPKTPSPSFAPAGAVTGIGSLPFTTSDSALSNVVRFSPEIPFWPQLPQLSEREGIINQGLGILTDLIEPRAEGYGYQVKPGRIDAVLEILRRSRGELTSANATGFGAFENALSSDLFSSALAVKGQIEGPITLSAYLFYEGRPFLTDSTLFAAMTFHVSQMICWQVNRLKPAGLPVLLFLDEPALCLDAPPGTVSEQRRLQALAATLEDARRQGALAGLHCCAARPLERMCLAKPDILSFDAHEGLESFFASKPALDFVRQGGTVAYGMVPTGPYLHSFNPMTTFTRWLQAASRAGDLQEFAQRSLITATCGLGLLEPSAVTESFAAAHQISNLVRKLAGMAAPDYGYALGKRSMYTFG